MKKLCYIANIRLPTEKAHGLAVMKICEAIASHGIEVELVVPKRINSIKENPFEFYGAKRNFKIKKIPCLDFVSLGRIGFLIQWFSFAVFAAIYCIFIRTDYYYGRDGLSLWLLSLIKRNVVWEAHTAQNNWYVRSLVRKGRTVVISKGLKQHYRLMGASEDQIFIAPSGVDLTVFESIKEGKEELRKKLGLPQEKKIIAYIGKRQTMGESKGVEELEEAFRSIVRVHPETQLLIVDQAPVAQVPLYMKAADILVMNYPNTPHYANFMSPLKLFEYMASGVPIVSSDLPTIREILDDSSAFFFTSDDRESLVQAISKVLSDPERARVVSEKARELSKKFTWEERVKKVKEWALSSEK